MSILERWRRGKGKDGGEPNTPGIPESDEIRQEAESQSWKSMDVPVNAVNALNQHRTDKLIPAQLNRITYGINAALKKSGFEFQVSYHEALGIMIDRVAFFEHNREDLSLPCIAVWRLADQVLRKKYKLDRQIEFDVEQKKELKHGVEGLLREGTRRVEERKFANLADQGSTEELSYKPSVRETAKELVEWEAEVQTLRKFGLKPGQEVPAEKVNEYQIKYKAQLEIAWKKFRKLRGIQEPDQESEGGEKE